MTRIGNLDARERRKRLLLGLVFGLLTAGLAAWLLATHQPRAARVLLAAPLALSLLGLLQAFANT